MVSGFPGIASKCWDLCGWELQWHEWSGIGVLVTMIQNEYVMIALTGGYRKTTCLIRICFEDVVFIQQQDTNLTQARFELGSNVLGCIGNGSN
jgi:hypothetical protein